MKRSYLRRHSASLIRGRPSARLTSGLDFHSRLNMTGNPVGLTITHEDYLHRRDRWIDKRIKALFGITRLRQLEPPRSATFTSPDPWIAVQRALDDLEKVAGEPEVIDRRITLVDTPLWALELLWSASRTRYKFIQFDNRDNRIRESIVYRSRERAYQVFERNEITWKKATVLPPS